MKQNPTKVFVLDNKAMDYLGSLTEPLDLPKKDVLNLFILNVAIFSDIFDDGYIIDF